MPTEIDGIWSLFSSKWIYDNMADSLFEFSSGRAMYK